MKYLKNFKNKLKELEEIKSKQNSLEKEITKDTKMIVKLIVFILDEIKQNNILVNIYTKNKKIVEIEHKHNHETTLHDSGIDTLIYFNNGDADILWNLSRDMNEEIFDIFVYLSNKYKDEYEKAIMKIDTKKFNL